MQNIHNIGHITFLEATTNSTVNFLKSHIVKNTLNYSLISVWNFSVVLFEDTIVENNNGTYTLVSMYNFSSLLVEGSIVRNNHVPFTIFLNTNYGHIMVKRTTFAKNRISNNYGMCFVVTNNVTVHIFDTVFYENQFQILQAEFNISIIFSNCHFVKNVNTPILGNIYYYGAIVVTNCNFINNFSNTSYSIEITYYMSLILRDSLFYNNSGIANGGIVIFHSFADISNVTFRNNHAIIQSSCFSLNTKARVKVKNSTFYGQSGIAVSAYITST